VRLLVFRCGALAFFLLLSDAPPTQLRPAAAAALRQLSERAGALAARLAAELPPKQIWHVPGLRYIYTDGTAGTERWVCLASGACDHRR
jgi:hypothetical protein